MGEGASGTLSALGHVLLTMVPGETASGGQGGILPPAPPDQGAPGPGVVHAIEQMDVESFAALAFYFNQR